MEISQKDAHNIIEPQRITATPPNSSKTEMTTYVHLDLRRISCRCSTSRKKDARLNVIERFYAHKEASLHNQLYHKHNIFPQYKCDTILKNDSFNPTVFLMPSIFYIPIHFPPNPKLCPSSFRLALNVHIAHIIATSVHSSEQRLPTIYSTPHLTNKQ